MVGWSWSITGKNEYVFHVTLKNFQTKYLQSLWLLGLFAILRMRTLQSSSCFILQETEGEWVTSRAEREAEGVGSVQWVFLREMNKPEIWFIHTVFKELSFLRAYKCKEYT